MDKDNSNQILHWLRKYKIAKNFSDEKILEALAKSDAKGKGFLQNLGVNSSYLTRECSRKIPKDIFEAKPKGRDWLYQILLLSNPCPVCGQLKNNLSATTCGYSCSNIYFRSGSNNPNYTGTNYRSICFSYHKKECIVCKEDKIVEVHHLDEDNTNNNPENLIPLCPTHHSYWHSKYRHLIEQTILDYVNNRV